jgi:endonuclease YncB( thermonuclease family)
MDHESRLIATQQYLGKRRSRRLIAFAIFTLVAASVILTHAGAFGQCGDDWSRYDHQTFRVIAVPSGDTIRISLASGSLETVRLLGIASPAAAAQQWLTDRTTAQDVTLLLQSPQTRDSSGALLAFAYIHHSNLSVEITQAGMARPDRQNKSIMDALIRSAEKESQKKKLGQWSPSETDSELLHPIS